MIRLRLNPRERPCRSSPSPPRRRHPRPRRNPPPRRKPAAPKPTPGPDLKIMQVQVILDHLGFSPGVIDGKGGGGPQACGRGLPEGERRRRDGRRSIRSTAAGLQKFAGTQPVREITLTPADLAGDFVGPIPHKEDAQAKLPSLGYSNPLEMLSERYHTTAAVLIALNSPDTKLVPGSRIKVPNVVTAGRAYPADLPELYKQTLAGPQRRFDAAAGGPSGGRQVRQDAVGVRRAGEAARAVPGDHGQCARPAADRHVEDHWVSIAIRSSTSIPSCSGTPSPARRRRCCRRGPNGPVGVVWMDLSKEHYGIHGTPVPENIGRTASATAACG